MTETISSGRQEEYEAASVATLLTGMTPRRPWQLLLTGDGIAVADAELVTGLARILELLPSVPGLTVETTQGTLVATRDFPSGSVGEVDTILAGLFRGKPDLTGIRFSGNEARPAHTATPDDSGFHRRSSIAGTE